MGHYNNRFGKIFDKSCIGPCFQSVTDKVLFDIDITKLPGYHQSLTGEIIIDKNKLMHEIDKLNHDKDNPLWYDHLCICGETITKDDILSIIFNVKGWCGNNEVVVAENKDTITITYDHVWMSEITSGIMPIACCDDGEVEKFINRIVSVNCQLTCNEVDFDPEIGYSASKDTYYFGNWILKRCCDGVLDTMISNFLRKRPMKKSDMINYVVHYLNDKTHPFFMGENDFFYTDEKGNECWGKHPIDEEVTTQHH